MQSASAVLLIEFGPKWNLLEISRIYVKIKSMLCKVTSRRDNVSGSNLVKCYWVTLLVIAHFRHKVVVYLFPTSFRFLFLSLSLCLFFSNHKYHQNPKTPNFNIKQIPLFLFILCSLKRHLYFFLSYVMVIPFNWYSMISHVGETCIFVAAVVCACCWCCCFPFRNHLKRTEIKAQPFQLF